MKQEVEIIRQLFNLLSDDDKRSFIKSLKINNNGNDTDNKAFVKKNVSHCSSLQVYSFC